jgi:hypothetical protein
MWGNIQKEIQAFGLDYTKVRLYQDGLPTCGNEEIIVRKLAEAGSLNHQILVELMGKGATITGTESPELLLQEYALACQVLTSGRLSQRGRLAARQDKLSKELLEKRDRYMADRINNTLRPGEVGLVFLGMLHSLRGLLQPDIRVSLVVPSLPPNGEERHGGSAAHGETSA